MNNLFSANKNIMLVLEMLKKMRYLDVIIQKQVQTRGTFHCLKLTDFL